MAGFTADAILLDDCREFEAKAHGLGHFCLPAKLIALDASVAEIICDRKHAITTRIYRQPDGPLRIVLSASDLAQITSLQAWQLCPISKDRLTS